MMSSKSPATSMSSAHTQALAEAYARHPHAPLAAVWAANRRQVLQAAACYFLGICCVLSTPVAIYALLRWVETPASTGLGVAYVIALAAASVTSFIAEYASERVAKSAGMKSAVALQGLIFRKVLGLSVVDAQASHSGELISIFATDAAALHEFWQGVVGLVLQPVEIVGNIAILWVYVGHAAFGGVAVVLGALIITNLCSAAVGKLTAARSALADERTRETYEMLLGMKVVKLNAWEERFASTIRSVRAAETALFRRMGQFLAVINVTSSNSVDVISLAIILIYTLALGQTLTAPVTFTFWVLLSMLHARIFHFPIALKHVREGREALMRIQAFLSTAERQDARSVTFGRTTPTAAGAAVASDAFVAQAGAAAVADDAVVSLVKANFTWSASAAVSDAQPGAAAAPGSAVSDLVLADVSLEVPRGSCFVIVGSVATAKSTLLQSLLGETRQRGGHCGLQFAGAAATNGALPIAYAPQTAWLYAATARDNIVFGRPWDAERYKAIVHACALERDFTLWPNGDQTVVGQVSVSGGQRARLALARSAYAQAELYLFDDCLSSCDQKVTRHIVDNLFCGLLAGATRIVVTNSPLVMRASTHMAVMVPAAALATAVEAPQASMSTVAAAPEIVTDVVAPQSVDQHAASAGPFTAVWGTFASLSRHPVAAPLLHRLSSGESGDVDELGAAVVASSSPNVPSDTAAALTTTQLVVAPAGPGSSSSVGSVATVDKGPLVDSPPAPAKPPTLPFFWNWLSGVGGVWYAIMIAIFLFGEAACVEVGVYWLALWSEDGGGERFTFAVYMWVYIAFVAGELLSAYIRQHFYVCGTAIAQDSLHDSLLFRLTHAPMTFFDAHSVGEIVSWLSSDMAELDSLTFYASEYLSLGALYGILIVLSQLVVSAWVLVPAAAVVVILTLVWAAHAGKLQCTCRRGSKTHGADGNAPSRTQSFAELLQAESRTQQPLLRHYSDCLSGLTTIRSMGAQQYVVDMYDGRMDANADAASAVHASKSLQVLTGSLIGALYYVASVALIVPLRVAAASPITSGSAGFIVVNSCFSSSMVNLVLEHFANLASLASVRSRLIATLWAMPAETTISEQGSAATAAGVRRTYAPYAARMKPAAPVPPAPPCIAGSGGRAMLASVTVATDDSGSSSVDPAWPRSGSIVFRGVSVRYRPDGPDVLRGLNLILPHGCHVACVGRTGSGKSTTLASLTRLVDCTAGSIMIDGMDIARVPLRHLRSRLTVVSQDPLFFTATLRQNLDPFGEFTDDQLLTALSRVGLQQLGASAREGTHSAGAGDDATAAPTAAASKSSLDFMVAERAQNLSLGEQQLLAAARSWLRRKQILLVDEGTASIDARSEHMLQETLQREFAGSTVVQVAHRLASVIESHFVVVLQDGEIVEAGHPHDLLNLGTPACTDATGALPSGGIFASLVDAMPAGQAVDLRRRAADARSRDAAHLVELAVQANLLAASFAADGSIVWRPGGPLVRH